MKFTYKIIVVAMCFVATFGIIGYGSLLTNENSVTQPPNTKPEVQSPDNNLPPIVPPDNNIPPTETVPPAPLPTIEYDRLIKVNSSVINILESMNSSKVIGKVYRNDMLPLIAEKNGYYQTVFNHKTAYVYKNSSVSIAKFEKSTKNVEKIIDEAKKLIGVPYLLGAERYHWGNGIKNSKFSKYLFDCSSFTQYVLYKSNNILLDVTSRSQSVQGKYVSKNNLKRGDLMFFTNSSRYNNVGVERIGHVSIYMGDNYIIHTSSDYAIIEPITEKRWSYYISSRRFV